MRYSKYRAVPTVVDGIRFASKKEAQRYKDLRLLEQNGDIWNLRLQVPFPLQSIDGSIIGKYICDFDYLEDGTRIVEDCKGAKTPLYSWKKKHFEAQYGIKIRET